MRRVGDAERVTSVVTAYRPGRELITSVRSLAAQSWTNHEILLVDDGSPHGHDDVLRAAVALDPRVRLIRGPRHDGRYVARNTAMDRATGTYVSFQEPDSWSHPLRLERQVAALRAEPGAAGVTCAALLTSADLRDQAIVRGPLMVRRTAERFDPVRHGGEDEFVHRLGTVRQLDGESLAVLLRRPGDRHPAARQAYRSAYRMWHRTGVAPPADRRPWPLLDRRGRRACDVLLVADWTRGDAGLGQLRALRARGLRVTMLHLGSGDDFHTRTQKSLNDGEAELADLGDDIRARLVVVRDPALLPLAGQRSGIRATRVILEAPGATARTRHEELAGRLFRAAPAWAPAGPETRAALADRDLTELDVPGTIDAAGWRVDRRDGRSRRPVVGRLCAGGRAEWRRLHAELPDHPGIDVRLRAAVPDGATPADWLIYDAADVGPRAFLQQLDYYPALPAARTPADPEPGALAALAAGCVVVLPDRYAPAYGDAAVYSTPAGLADTVRALHGRRAAVAGQRERGIAFVRRQHSHDVYAERISALTP